MKIGLVCPYSVNKHGGVLEVFEVKAMLLLPAVEQGLRPYLMEYKRTAQENPVRVSQHFKRRVQDAKTTAVGRNQNSRIRKGPNETARHYQPFRRAKTSLRTSLRLRSLAPDAACSSASLRRMRPNSETSFLTPVPFFLESRFTLGLATSSF